MLGRNLLLAPLRFSNSFTRCRNFSNAARQSTFLKCKSTFQTFKRSASARVGYRTNPPVDPLLDLLADGMGTFFWTFQFYMAYHHGGHLFNYGVDYLDVTKLTDAQLGIEE